MPTHIHLILSKEDWARLSRKAPHSWKQFVGYMAKAQPFLYNHSDCWVEGITIPHLVNFFKTHKIEFNSYLMPSNATLEQPISPIQTCFNVLETKYEPNTKKLALKTDSRYRTAPAVDGSKCSNCQFMYNTTKSPQPICTQVRGYVHHNGWCMHHQHQAQPA